MKLNVQKHSNWSILLVVILFVVMWIYGGWNDYNTDLYNYQVRYNFPESFIGLDKGFNYLFAFFHAFGFTFAEAHIYIYGIALFIVCLLVLKWSKMPVIVLLLYFAYHYVRDVVEMRNFLAFVILLWSIRYVGSEKKTDKIKLMVGMLLAMSVHISYAPFLLLFFLRIEKQYNPIFLFPIFFGLSFVINIFVAGWVSMLGIGRLDDKLDNYLSMTHIANIASFLVISFNMFIIAYFKKKSDENISCTTMYVLGRNMSYMVYSHLMYNINVMCGVLIIFSAINFSFTGRLFGNVVFLNIIYLSNYFMLSTNKVLTDYICALLYIASVLYVFPMEGTHYIDVFTNNSLLR